MYFLKIRIKNSGNNSFTHTIHISINIEPKKTTFYIHCTRINYEYETISKMHIPFAPFPTFNI